MNLGRRIKEARELRQWEAEDLRRRVNELIPPGQRELSQQALSNLETRDSKTSEYAIWIADALEVSYRWLLAGMGDPRDREWFFERVPRAKWESLTGPEDRAWVQKAMLDAINECLANSTFTQTTAAPQTAAEKSYLGLPAERTNSKVDRRADRDRRSALRRKTA